MAYPPVIPPATRTNSTAELDAHPTDHNQLAAALSNMPWGRVAAAVNATGTGQSGIAAATDLTAMTVTFTRISGRVYHVMFNLTAQQQTAGGTFNIALADAANTTLANPGATLPVNAFFTLTHLHVLAAGTGALTLKLRASAGPGTVSILHAAANPTTLAVYDVGPV